MSYSRALFHYETDSDGVCHFSNYLRITEEAFFHEARSLVPHRTLAVVQSQVDYKTPLRFGDVFCVRLSLLQLRASNFQIKGSIFSDGGVLSATVTLRLVAVDKETWQPICLQDELKTLLRQLDTGNQPALV